jgi:hypothetical protein
MLFHTCINSLLSAKPDSIACYHILVLTKVSRNDFHQTYLSNQFFRRPLGLSVSRKILSDARRTLFGWKPFRYIYLYRCVPQLQVFKDLVLLI